MTGEVDHRPDLRLGVPLGAMITASALGPAVWAATVRDRLPEQVVRHWGPDGLPTATWGLTTQLWFVGAVTVLVAGGCGAVAVVSRLPLLTRRILAGSSAFLAVLFGVLQVGGLMAQLDVTDPLTSGVSVDPAMVAGILLGLLGAVVVGALAHEDHHGAVALEPPPADALRPVDATGPPEPWTSSAMTSRGLLWVAGGVVVLFSALSIPVGIGGAGIGLWLLGALLCGLVLATARVRTVIDADGVSVRAPGFRVLHVPLAQVARADVLAAVDPFWEFGGWGLRVDVHGRTGVVSRRGEALQVVRADGTGVVVTVDGAGGAAAALNAWADRQHLERSSGNEHDTEREDDT